MARRKSAAKRESEFIDKVLGNRSEFRLLEKIGIGVVRGLGSILGNQVRSRMGIEAKTVANAMFLVAQKEQKGIHVYSPEDMEIMQKANL